MQVAPVVTLAFWLPAIMNMFFVYRLNFLLLTKLFMCQKHLPQTTMIFTGQVAVLTQDQSPGGCERTERQ